MSGIQLRLDVEETERLVKLPAWERARLYDLVNLGLGERSMIETEIRARIAAEFWRRR